MSGQDDGPYEDIPLEDNVGLSQFGVHLERLPPCRAPYQFVHCVAKVSEEPRPTVSCIAESHSILAFALRIWHMLGMKHCRFCLSNNLLSDRPLFQNKYFYVLSMREPDRRHSLMIVAKRHSETPFEINSEEWAGIAEPLGYVKDALSIFNPSGYSIGWNVGTSAGQHVNHVHLHVICRFEGQQSTGLGINGLIQQVNNET